MVEKIKIEFQHFKGCPNGQLLLNNLKEAIAGYSDITAIQEVLVETPELAVEYKFRGSPTILINGKDLEDMPEPDNPGLACRVYSNGIPSSQFISQKLKEEIKS